MMREGKEWYKISWPIRVAFGLASEWTRTYAHRRTFAVSSILSSPERNFKHQCLLYYRERNQSGLSLPALEALLLWANNLPIFKDWPNGYSIPLGISSDLHLRHIELVSAVQKEMIEKKETRYEGIVTTLARLIRAIEYAADYAEKEREHDLGGANPPPVIAPEWIT